MGFIGIAAGVVLAFRAEVNEFTGEEEHPYIPLGIGIAVGSAFQACLVIMVASYIQFRVESRKP